MTEKRFNLAFYDKYDGTFSIQDALYQKENKYLHSLDEIVDLLNKLEEENEELKFENKNLKVAIQARDAKIEVCEKKLRELGYIITVDDDGYVIE